MPSSTPVITVRGLRKSYGKVEAVRGIDLSVSGGEVFALLGPNGAGKTTTVEILEGQRDRTAGEVWVLGHDPGRNERALKRRIGIVLQSTGVEPYLRVEETIDLFRGYYPHPLPTDEILDVIGLREQRRTLVRRLSGGQQRRLDVAIGLAGDPELLFLDEPTTGFDPSARRGAWEMIRNLRSLGKTVVLTTHYMDEAEHLADRVAIMVDGQIVAVGAPAELVRKDRATTIRFRAAAGSGDPPAGLGAQPTDQQGGYAVTDRHTDPNAARAHRLGRGARHRACRADGLAADAGGPVRRARGPRRRRPEGGVNAFVLALRQVRYENTAFWRNPVSAFFVFVFPLMILAIFNLLFGNRELNVAGGTTHTATFYVPAIMALSVIYTCFHNVAIGVCYGRERGLLKRTRGTPLPSWAFLFGRIAHAVLLAILLVAIVTGVGALFYNVDIPSNTLPALALTLVVGAATFCALALAVTAIIPNADASPAVVNGATLPLLFISDVFIPLSDAPRWLTIFADIFPVKRLAAAMHTAFNPFETGAGFEWVHLLVMLGWMVVALVVAVRYFSWEPRS